QRYATVDLLLGPIQSSHRPVATRELRYQAYEANSRRHLSQNILDVIRGPGDVSGETRNIVEKRYNSGTSVEAGVLGPRLQRVAKHVKPLTLGEVLGCEIAILRREVIPFVAILALVAIIMASLSILDERSHSYLHWPSFAFVFVIATDGEGAFSLQRCI